MKLLSSVPCMSKPTPESYFKLASDIDALQTLPLAPVATRVIFLTSEFPTAKSPRVLLTGDTANAIAETAKENKFNLMLVIRRSLQGALGHLQDLTYSLVRDSPCPVVTV